MEEVTFPPQFQGAFAEGDRLYLHDSVNPICPTPLHLLAVVLNDYHEH